MLPKAIHRSTDSCGIGEGCRAMKSFSDFQSEGRMTSSLVESLPWENSEGFSRQNA